MPEELSIEIEDVGVVTIVADVKWIDMEEGTRATLFDIFDRLRALGAQAEAPDPPSTNGRRPRKAPDAPQVTREWPWELIKASGDPSWPDVVEALRARHLAKWDHNRESSTARRVAGQVTRKYEDVAIDLKELVGGMTKLTARLATEEELAERG